MCLSLINLTNTIKIQEKEIKELQVITIIIEQRQKNLFDSYGG